MKFHDELNPKLWDYTQVKIPGAKKEYVLWPEVADKLKEIADAFIESLEIPLDAVTDCVITGSSASYNYTPYSDIDLHLKVDFDKVHEDCPVVKGYLNAIKAAFNSNHDIHIHGIPVEVYAEGINEDTVHNGLYSLWQAKWIDEPQKIPPTENDAAVNAKFKEIAEQIDQIEDSELAVELLNKVYEMRKAGLTEAGEFSTENLAFKKLRDEGYLQKLRDIKKAKVDKELSLEKRTEQYDGFYNPEYIRGKDLQKGHIYILSKEMGSIGYTSSDFTEKEIQKIRPYVKFKFNDEIFEVDRDTKLVYRGKFRDPYNEPGNRSIKLEIMGTGVILELSEGDTFEEVDQKNESEKVYIKTESIELDPDVLKVVNEVSSDVNFFNNFTELKPGQYLVRRQTYTTHYIPTRDFDYVMYKTQPEFPKESHWDREGYFDVKLMEEPVVAYVKGRYENPLQVVNCTKLCTYYDSVGDIDEGGTWYKEFYHEILRIDSVEPINYETAEHTTEEAYAILGLEYPYKLI